MYEQFQLIIKWSDYLKKIQCVAFQNVAKIATLNAYKILASALEAWIEENEDEDNDDNRSQGDYEQENEEYFSGRGEVLE